MLRYKTLLRLFTSYQVTLKRNFTQLSSPTLFNLTTMKGRRLKSSSPRGRGGSSLHKSVDGIKSLNDWNLNEFNIKGQHLHFYENEKEDTKKIQCREIVNDDSIQENPYKYFEKLPPVLKTMFLPINFPSSVHSSYFNHHKWLFWESTFAGAINCLVQQAMLEGLGIGATPEQAGGLAIAVQWVLKEGFGDIGKIAFTNRFSSTFDLRPKSWKFFGEWMSGAGSLLMLSCSVCPPSYFLLFAGTGTAMRAIGESKSLSVKPFY